MVTIKNSAMMTTNLASGRYFYNNDYLSIYSACFRLKIKRRIDFLGVVNWSHKIFLHPILSIWRNCHDFSIIFYAEEYYITISIWKWADSIINIIWDLSCSFLKLYFFSPPSIIFRSSTSAIGIYSPSIFLLTIIKCEYLCLIKSNW